LKNFQTFFEIGRKTVANFHPNPTCFPEPTQTFDEISSAFPETTQKIFEISHGTIAVSWFLYVQFFFYLLERYFLALLIFV